jgi:hypothetical protein
LATPPARAQGRARALARVRAWEGLSVEWIGCTICVPLHSFCLCDCSIEPPQTPSQIEREHTAWIAGALNAMQTIKVGMTRSDLVKLFTTEGGLSATSQRMYVYRQCPHTKVDVKFAASSRHGELPTDKIVEVSRPCLAWPVMD